FFFGVFLFKLVIETQNQGFVFFGVSNLGLVRRSYVGDLYCVFVLFLGVMIKTPGFRVFFLAGWGGVTGA
ncbi:hypothetical protein ACVGW6_00200, partial [Enterobacter intestinihominis]